MATETYSVTPGMVLERLPISGITATSKPLSTTDISAYIEDCASELSGILANAGHDLTDLDDDTLTQVQSAVVMGAVYLSLDKIPGTSTGRITSARVAWEDAKNGYKRRPATLTKQNARSISNVDTSAGKAKSTFGGIGYEF